MAKIIHKRAVALKGSPVGKARQQLFSQLCEKVKEAKQNSFYIEAVALEESIIVDRFTSYLTAVNNMPDPNENTGYISFGALCEKIQADKEFMDTFIGCVNRSKVYKLKSIHYEDIFNSWRRMRNKAVHAMASLTEDEISKSKNHWKTKYNAIKEAAIEGNSLFRLVDATCKILRKKAKNEVTA